MHPIQYHAPIFRALSKVPGLESIVLYADKIGLEEIFNPEFNTTIKWDVPLLEGYNSIFFKNYAVNKITGYFSRINPGIFFHVLSNKYDAVLIHGYQTFSAWLVLFAAKISRKSIIVRGEGLVKDGTKTIFSRIKAMSAKTFLWLSDVVMYSCSGNKQYWRSLGVPEEKMKFIPCAVDNSYFKKQYMDLLPNRKKSRKKLGIDDDDFVVLFSARFTERKRPFDLIKAASIANNNKIVILFVGDGVIKKDMEEMAREHNVRTIFTGFINQSELSKYYSLADMFAVISSYDASPKALNEAMNFYLPVIASTRVGTADDLVLHEKNGFQIKPGDIEGLAKHLKYLSENRGRSHEMGQQSKLLVEDWTIEKDAQAIMQAVIGLSGGSHL